MKQKYLNNYAALKTIPIVQDLIAKNKLLKKENKNLRNALSLLGEIKCKSRCKKNDIDVISVYSDDAEENITYSVENKEKIIYTDNEETELLDESSNKFKNIIIKEEKTSNEEDIIVGDISPRCWSVSNSNQNLKEYVETSSTKDNIINRIKEEKKLKKEQELIIQVEEIGRAHV